MLRGRFGLLAQPLINSRQMVVRRGVVGAQLDGALELAGRAREIAAALEQDAELVMRFPKIVLSAIDLRISASI